MNTLDFEKIWHSNDDQLDQKLLIDQEHILQITRKKVSSTLAQAKPIKKVAIVLGILWVIFVDYLIIHLFSMDWIFFIISAGIHSIITKIAIGVYIYHLVMIDQVDNSKSIIEVQEKLANLKNTMFFVTRLLLIQLPLFTIFQLNFGMFGNPHIGWWIFQIMMTILFTIAGLWFFFNLKPENAQKKWFRFLFRNKEWTSLEKSSDILHQIDELKNELE